MKIILILLMFIPQYCMSCERYIIGFKGINDLFDSNAFNQYAKKIKSCPITYSWNQSHLAIKFINRNKIRYQLYGYSKGAESIKHVLKNVKHKPYSIITIGAYHTAQVNYSVYGIETRNYFDSSGKRNIAPGIHINNVSHQAIQGYVNKKYLGVN